MVDLFSLSLPNGGPVQVYRGQSDCTNGGASSRFYLITLEQAKGLPEVEFTENVGVLCYFYGNLIIKPLRVWRLNQWCMFGGNFAYSSDSRFPAKHPLKIFDRVEIREQQKIQD